ncbi:hypothetical protein HDU85_003092 [Gaertneriomyces sp. JEL0708]|nr:hypothetical protein HDU85_003092 [Gaertneriomyces sp. JEL0708]
MGAGASKKTQTAHSPTSGGPAAPLPPIDKYVTSADQALPVAAPASGSLNKGDKRAAGSTQEQADIQKGYEGRDDKKSRFYKRVEEREDVRPGLSESSYGPVRSSHTEGTKSSHITASNKGSAKYRDTAIDQDDDENYKPKFDKEKFRKANKEGAITEELPVIFRNQPLSHKEVKRKEDEDLRFLDASDEDFMAQILQETEFVQADRKKGLFA